MREREKTEKKENEWMGGRLNLSEAAGRRGVRGEGGTASRERESSAEKSKGESSEKALLARAEVQEQAVAGCWWNQGVRVSRKLCLLLLSISSVARRGFGSPSWKGGNGEK